MSFALPELDETGYRLLRLWRIILACVLMPVSALVLVQLVYWPFTGQAPAHFIAFGMLCALPIALHVVLLPNAARETILIGFGFSALVIVEPFISGFGILRLVALIGFCLIVLRGQGVLDALLSRSKATQMKTRASVMTDASAQDARDCYTLKPNQNGARYTCGPIGVDPFDKLANAPIDHTPVTPTDVLYWAKVAQSTATTQITQIYDRDALGELTQTATIEHSFKTVKNGIKVQEIEQVDACPIGHQIVLRLVDYQKDGLVHQRDDLEGRTSMALREAHTMSLQQYLAGLLPQRFAREITTS